MFHWLFLDESGISQSELTRWRVSALRIILFSGIILEATVAIHSSLDALAIGAYHVIVIVAVFYALLSAGLYYSARRPECGAGLLIATVYCAGAAITLFVNLDEVAKLGIIFVYTTPIIARLFFGGRLAIGLMLFNFLPFFYLLQGKPLVHFHTMDITLAASHTYIQSLLFLFFNICIPLAVFRVLHALDASAIRYREASAALATSHEQYREFFEHSGGPIVLCAADGTVLQANRMAVELLGGTAPTLVGTPLPALFESGGGAPAEQGLPIAEGQEFAGKKGQRISIQYVSRTTQGHSIVVLNDASSLLRIKEALRRSKEREQYLSNYDTLTQLPNKEMLRRHLADTLSRLDADRIIALVSFRLNSVRHANEKYGAATGDLLIRRFGSELRDALPGDTFCARLRSIVFSVVLAPATTPAEVVHQVERLRSMLPEDIDLDGKNVFVQVSTGIALARTRDIPPEELIRRSEVALDSARRSSDDSATLFDEADAARIRRNIEIELGMVAALKNAEFRLVYQPKVNADGRITGLEALIRWNSSGLGIVPPDEFIPIAESCGLIHDITRRVIDEVCAFIRRTIDRGSPCPPVALNLSAIDIVRHDLLEHIDESTARHRVPPGLLEFEITETGLIGNEALAIRHLRELEKRGNSISIDDFGTGYSSLSKLSSFPVHGIKIDQSFVARIGSCRKSELIIKAIVSLADMMSCITIAEGVERENQEAFLRSIGCEMFQGYYYYHPMEAAQIAELLLAAPLAGPSPEHAFRSPGMNPEFA
ncbi:putative bifunctional diguanylate cyclase/phosphodiesterase [Propionivibrio sp.]|uniref:putative bifunctional diguanylate cyclase/phosphodiesterase n=1 Tax=Propionivibrio sp. TaxID=2212460 RepID=UPI0039E232D7